MFQVMKYFQKENMFQIQSIKIKVSFQKDKKTLSDSSDYEALPQIPKPKIRNSEKETSDLTTKKQNIKRRILQLSENETDSTLVVDNEPQIIL